jgi:hypothetical protein
MLQIRTGGRFDFRPQLIAPAFLCLGLVNGSKRRRNPRPLRPAGGKIGIEEVSRTKRLGGRLVLGFLGAEHAFAESLPVAFAFDLPVSFHGFGPRGRLALRRSGGGFLRQRSGRLDRSRLDLRFGRRSGGGEIPLIHETLAESSRRLRSIAPPAHRPVRPLPVAIPLSVAVPRAILRASRGLR